jgi:hypothetical protein
VIPEHLLKEILRLAMFGALCVGAVMLGGAWALLSWIISKI